ncbi:MULTISPECIES: DUF3054 domain-containing protein [Kocuria]|uniref:DUF3054 domain-containing protein n=1 Tax=Kocuria subflava TaxID=1736139 RepID=A0A846TQ72_9MICC|nr:MULTISPECIES: DUF3054 domain-containing protein [Kocuria]NKE08969.1 DUF3054 domain-containing protein [Kocuria subflava]
MIPEPLPPAAGVKLPVKNVRGAVVLWVVIDVLLICVFATVGRAAHGENPLGFPDTAWPFLAAAAVGWVGIAMAGRPGISIQGGLLLWIVTVVGGMALRTVSGQGVEPSFILVASTVLLVFLVGWRAIAGTVLRRRRHTRSASNTSA